MLITVTDPAQAKIREVVKEKGDSPTIRVYVTGMGCGGPTWGLAVDEHNELDEVLTATGFRVAADKKMLDEFGGVTVDYQKTNMGEGFRITPGKTLGKTCGNGRCSC